MPTPDDPKINTESTPKENSGESTDQLLDKTQFFADDSSPSGAGSNSSGSGTGKASSTSTQRKSVGGYRLMRMLGEGGMGRVFQAVDESGRMVAIKLLSPELSRSPEALERFKQEGIIASAISHPHCVFVHRADEDSGTPFIAMELMTGQTLKDIVSKRGPLPFADAIPLALQCIDGLIEAHSRGMIHRDVKPANCYLDDRGNVKIGDFGLARSLVSDSELTRTGSFLGTPLYASPEQILGEKVDEQSDIYSLAATIYFLLAGKAPFESPHATQVIAKIVSADPPTFSEAGVQVPRKLEQVLLRGLARDRSKRYSTFREFRDDLVQILEKQDATATLTRRVLAYAVDNFLLTLTSIPMFVPLIFGSWGIEFQYINLVGALWQGVYLLFCESIFGTTPGKRLLSMRVVDPATGARPKFWQCSIRTFVFIGVFSVFELTAVVLLMVLAPSILAIPAVYGAISWIGAVIGFVATLSVWRINKNKLLLHDWVSNTQTWVTAPRTAVKLVELPDLNWAAKLKPIEPSLDLPSRLGRFEVLGKIATMDGSNWLSAHDGTIDRSVWIQLSPSSVPAPDETRQKCVRGTRMRFLESGIAEEWRWDAYVAPDGVPVSLWFDYHNPMPWPIAQRVLQDAIAEVTASDSPMDAASAGIGSWWLTSSGKLTLSEATIETGIEPKETSPISRSLFGEIAKLALPDKPKQPPSQQRMEAAKGNASKWYVAPWRATKLLQSMKDGKVSDPSVIRKELDRVSKGPQSVTVTMRVIHGIVLSLLFFVPWTIIAVAMVAPLLVMVVDKQKDARTFKTLAGVLSDPNEHSDLINGIEAAKRGSYLEPSKIAQIEKASYERHEQFLKAHNSFSIAERGLIELMNQVRGRDNFTDKPTPDFASMVGTDEAKKEAEKAMISSREEAIKSTQLNTKRDKVFGVIRMQEPPQTVSAAIARFESYDSELTNPAPKRWFSRVRDLTLIPLSLLVIWGGLFRGGWTHAASGIAVVRRDGRRGWIWQCMLRSLLFWLPLLLVAGFALALDAQGTEWIWWTEQLRICFFVLPLVYLIIAFRWPSRGPHDVLSGTFVVPR